MDLLLGIEPIIPPQSARRPSLGFGQCGNKLGQRVDWKLGLFQLLPSQQCSNGELTINTNKT